jgi:hypothetical protein
MKFREGTYMGGITVHFICCNRKYPFSAFLIGTVVCR